MLVATATLRQIFDQEKHVKTPSYMSSLHTHHAVSQNLPHDAS